VLDDGRVVILRQTAFRRWKTHPRVPAGPGSGPKTLGFDAARSLGEAAGFKRRPLTALGLMLPCPGLLRRADPPVSWPASCSAAEAERPAADEDEDAGGLLMRAAAPRCRLASADEALDGKSVTAWFPRPPAARLG